MKYTMFVVADPTSAAEERDHPSSGEHPTIEQWVAEVDAAGQRVDGDRLRPAVDATTVRVSRDEVIVTDGPFTESKEWIAGFDILVCDDLDEAIRIRRTEREKLARVAVADELTATDPTSHRWTTTGCG